MLVVSVLIMYLTDLDSEKIKNSVHSIAQQKRNQNRNGFICIIVLYNYYLLIVYKYSIFNYTFIITI